MVYRDGSKKLINGLGSGGFSGGRGVNSGGTKKNAKQSGSQNAADKAQYQYYNLVDDLGEANNLAAAEPENVQVMLQRMQAIKNGKGHRFAQ
jgi:hypothetical protein